MTDAGTADDDATGLEASLPVDPMAPGLARAAVRGVLSHGEPGVEPGVAQLLVSELVSNAVKCGAAMVTVRAHVRRGELHVEVADDADRWPPSGPHTMPPPTATGGRGLALLEALSDAWGVRPDAAGKAVWFVLRSR